MECCLRCKEHNVGDKRSSTYMDGGVFSEQPCGGFWQGSREHI